MNKVRSFLDELGLSLEKTALPRDVKSPAPQELHFELTFNCNADCIMCNVASLKKNEPELDIDEIRGLLDDSRLLDNIKYVIFSGGEPWLKKDFVRLVCLVKEKYGDAQIHILSNLLDRDLAVKSIQGIKDACGLERISIGSSLDGINQAHDRMRGVKDGFIKLNKTITALKELFPGLNFSFNFTLSPANYDQLLPVFNWSAENNYHVSFQVVVQKKETEQLSWKADQLDAVDAQLDEMIRVMCEAVGVKNGIELLPNEGLLSRMLSLHYIGKYIRYPRRYFPNCVCGEKFAVVNPYGELYFCPVNKDMVFGNIKKGRFDELWGGREAGKVRDFLNRRTCSCWLTCAYGFMIGDALSAGKMKYVKERFSAE